MTLIDIIFFTIFSLGIVYLYFWRFRQFRVDKFRQCIFVIREDLFDYAANGNISFTHPAYRVLRNMLNGYIRFSHQISLFHLCIHSSKRMKALKRGPRFDKIWEDALRDVTLEQRKELESLLFRATGQLMYFVFLSSLVKKIFFVPIVLIIAFSILANGKIKSISAVVKMYKERRNTVRAYVYSDKKNAHFRTTLENFNTDAFVFGSDKTVAAA